MPSFSGSQGAALATAVVVSGTVILMVFRRKGIFPVAHLEAAADSPRPCIASGKKRNTKTKSKKRVRFAHDVLEPSGNNEEFRRKHTLALKLRYEGQAGNQDRAPAEQEKTTKQVCRKVRNMPENQAVLYNGILRDRVRRMAASY
ncbi:uncharacterized protein LOC116267458 [Nymphaea colorata]|nr:uncharacterized protein LOC116267458 [Nymphaea colorata]